MSGSIRKAAAVHFRLASNTRIIFGRGIGKGEKGGRFPFLFRAINSNSVYHRVVPIFFCVKHLVSRSFLKKQSDP